MRTINILIILIGFISALNAQQMISFTLTKPPCKENGVLKATLPSSAQNPSSWYWYYNGKGVVKDSVNSLTDSIIDYAGGQVYLSVITKNNTTIAGNFDSNLPFEINISTKINTCPTPSIVEVKTLGGTPPFTYEWFKEENSNLTKIGTTNPINVSNGHYVVIVTDANGCTVDNLSPKQDSNYLYITAPVGFSYLTEVTEANCTNGSAKVVNLVGGKAPFTYSWSNGSNSSIIQNLVAGNYPVTVTDADGCSSIKQEVIVRQSKQINVTTTSSPSNCKDSDGSLIAFSTGGTAPYTYQWNNGETTQSIKNLTTGSYFLQVTDKDGCTGSSYSYVNNLSPVQVSITNTVPSSCTSPTGSATLTITGGKAPYKITWNTSPVQNGLTLSNVSAGNYSFIVTDNNNCERTGIVTINPESNIIFSSNVSDAICKSSTGAIITNISGAAMPINYSWSNGKNTKDINNLQSGYYTLTITDNKNCSLIKSMYVNESSPISIGFANNPATCIFSKDGSIVANIKGGVAPYSYQWGNGTTSSSLNGVGTGNYYLYVTDSNGCKASDHTYLGYNPAGNDCYCTIEGTVYHDINENCNRDNGEDGIQNIQIYCKGIGFTYTDEYGHYSFKVPSGTYEISESINTLYPLSTCQNNKNVLQIIASTGCVKIVNFGNIINPIHDTHITLWSDNLPIPGFKHSQNLVVTNAGTIKENDIVSSYYTDNQIGVPSFVPNSIFAQQQTGYYTSNNIADLEPGKSQVFKVNYTVPTSIPLSTELYYKDTTAYIPPMTNWLIENSPWNNVNQLTEYVVGSFDPNFIQVSPKGLTDKGYISKNDSTLEYMIHFQNYGNYFAQNVVVTCQLNDKLEWKSLKPIYSSFPATISISETGLMQYSFKNINLYPNNWVEELSKGFFTFTIKTKSGLTPLTKIENEADIYFDFNEPVRTNIALNTIEKLSDNEDSIDNSLIQKIYPNPASFEINVLLSRAISNKFEVSILDVFGRKLSSKWFENNLSKEIITLDVSDIPSGFYFVQISQNGNNNIAKKVSIIKE